MTNRRLVRIRRKRMRLAAGMAMVLIVLAFIFGATHSSAKSSEPTVNRTKCYTSVYVQPGDTLWNIAERHLSPEYDNANDLAEEIMQINHISTDVHSGCYVIVPFYTNAR